MTHAFDFSLTRVPSLMRSYQPSLKLAEDMIAMGLTRDGELVVGVLFEGYNGKNLWMHVAERPGKCWLHPVY
ncbi:MAG: hypothetical protein EBT59_10150 [Betaproteobacteria bacterium]|jgi:hypothetical protein|nr:hypothetical protein [Betaproteobacteria bacterium]NBT99483.1 hypothetical protein [Betaproteobacteria bacterium]